MEGVCDLNRVPSHGPCRGLLPARLIPSQSTRCLRSLWQAVSIYTHKKQQTLVIFFGGTEYEGAAPRLRPARCARAHHKRS